MSIGASHRAVLLYALMAGGGLAAAARSESAAFSGVLVKIADPASAGTTADFDGDGIPDLALASLSGRITILSGRPGGSLQFNFAVSLSTSLNGITSGDWNADGHPDIAAAGAFVGLLINNGTGGLLGGDSLPLPSNAGALIRGDLDADGRPDLLATHDSGVSVFLGLGDGGFASGPSIAHASPCSPLLGDFDEDGLPDLVVGDLSGNSIWIFKNLGAGAFGPGTEWPLGSGPQDLEFGDFDADGHLDLVSVCSLDTTLTILPGLGDGTFAAPTSTPVPVGSHHLDAGDLDLDGALDLVVQVTGADSGAVSLLGNGDGSFAPAQGVMAGSTGTAILREMDGNGTLDLISIPLFFIDDIRLYLGRGNGSFWRQLVTAPTGVSLGCSFLFCGGLAVPDLNGDQVPDLAYPGSLAGPASLALFFGDGQGGVAGSTVLPGSPQVGSFGTLAALDLDSDGMLDLAAAEGSFFGGSASLDTWINLGAGSFGPATLHGSHLTTAFGALAVGDVDGDGLQDLAYSGQDITTPSVAVLASQGDGTLVLSHALAIANTNSGLALADLDSDGDTDLLTTDIGKTLVNPNGGAAGFGFPVSSPGKLASNIELADMDLDGRLDLVLATTDSLSLWINQGDLSFAPGDLHATQTTSVQRASAAVADIDGDELLDVAMTNANVVSVFRGQGDGTLVKLDDYDSGGSGASAVVLADLDGDSAPEIVVLTDDTPQILHNLFGHPWCGLHGALSGSAGEPALAGVGDLQRGTRVTITLANTAPRSLASLVLGHSLLAMPFKGGLLLPNPDVLVPGLPTGPLGTLSWSVLWPSGIPSGISFYLQSWISDPGGPAGFAASNGLSAIVP